MTFVIVRMLPTDRSISVAFELEVSFYLGRGILSGAAVHALIRFLAKLPEQPSFDMECDGKLLGRCMASGAPFGDLFPFVYETATPIEQEQSDSEAGGQLGTAPRPGCLA